MHLCPLRPLHTVSSSPAAALLQYSADELLRLRLADPRLSRPLRKIVFSLGLRNKHCVFTKYDPDRRKRHRTGLVKLGTHRGLSTDATRPRRVVGTHGLQVGLLNARSVSKKIATIHDVIFDDRLDVMFLSETWLNEEAPDAIVHGLAPPGFNILHAHRFIRREDGHLMHGGGLAVL